MKILFMAVGLRYEPALAKAFRQRGYEVIVHEINPGLASPFARPDSAQDEKMLRGIAACMDSVMPELVFSFGFYPLVSLLCMSMKISPTGMATTNHPLEQPIIGDSTTTSWRN